MIGTTVLTYARFNSDICFVPRNSRIDPTIEASQLVKLITKGAGSEAKLFAA
jgi:hypothetical protein